MTHESSSPILDLANFRLNPEQVSAFQLTARIVMARRYAKEGRVLDWGKVVFPDRFKLPFCQELHGYQVSTRRAPFAWLEAPRGSAKTTIMCFLVLIFQALEEPGAFAHYVNLQATEDKALAVNRSIKYEIENNQVIRAIYGDIKGERWTDGQFVIQHRRKFGEMIMKSGREVVFTAIGAGQSIRGLNYNNRRPDYVVVDDLYDYQHINNPESTMKVNEWFWSDLYKALVQGGRCSIHVQGTAINKHDLLEQLKNNPNVAGRTFQEVVDFEKKLLLWPEQKTFEQAMAEKANMPETIWLREAQNTRRDDAMSIVKLAWLQNWEYDSWELNAKLADRKMQVVSVKLGNDPSVGKKGEDKKTLRSDFTGTALVVITRQADSEGRDFWIEGLYNEKLGMQERIDQLKQIAGAQAPERRITSLPIEAIGAFDDYAQEVARTTNLPVERVEWVPDKLTNLEVRSHYFRNGKVHLNRNIDPRMKAMIVDQLTQNYPLHDDLRDGLLLCIDLAENDWWNHV